MLQELTIRNFAIIEDLHICFDCGLTILSGETGAGKSIIINAVNLLLGSRASANLIRTGAQSAELEALFDVRSDSRAALTMADQGYDASEGLLVRRIISRNDRHRVYINGRLATMQVLTAITANLASISGQHANQGLLKEDEHLYILDQFGGLLPLRAEYKACYHRTIPLIDKLQSLKRRKMRQKEQIELLRFQQQEIDAASLSAGEDEALEKEQLRLKNSETLYHTVKRCVDELYTDQGAVAEQLGQMEKELSRVAVFDDALASKATTMAEMVYGIEDVAIQLREYFSRIDTDPQQLEMVEARLDELNKLKRKYGGSLEAVLAYRQEIGCQLNAFENLDTDLRYIQIELKEQHAQLCHLAADLSAQRQKAAQHLASRVEKELASLKMATTQFQVDLQFITADQNINPYLSTAGRCLTESGSDRAVFMIAPNVGEAIKPLSAIASGGELSRVVLALKAILAQTDSLQTVVFDEVDAGIGGDVAELVGKKLAALAKHHQVLCITHLPQIARHGQHHFRIIKNVAKGRTRTTITPLSEDQRVEEIARMLGGEKISATVIDHAREMLGV